MSYPVTVCIIAKNEEKYIEECLRHLMPYGMEIIVTDTGSTDRTKEIARKYANKVLDFEWTDDFSAARNFCAGHAGNNWILAIDCDEYVQNIDTKLMRIYMQKYPRSAGTICIKSIARRNNGEIGYADEDIIRFYNRNFYEFAYPVHESVEPKRSFDISEKQRECFRVPVEVVHHGYNISGAEMRKKQERNLQMLYTSLKNENTREAYTYFQIGQSEQMIGNIENAVNSYSKCLELENDTMHQYINTCIIELATAYAQRDEPQKALELMEHYKDKIKTPRFIYTYGLALLGTEQFLKALLQFIMVSAMPDKEMLGEDLLYCYQHIIRLYTLLGEPQMAQPFREKYAVCLRERESILGKYNI